MSKKIKKGDNVIVITGKDKGKTGEVFIIDRKNLKAKVRGINIVKKHRKPSQDQPGGIEQIETFINISNISLIDPNPSCTALAYSSLALEIILLFFDNFLFSNFYI